MCLIYDVSSYTLRFHSSQSVHDRHTRMRSFQTETCSSRSEVKVARHVAVIYLTVNFWKLISSDVFPSSLCFTTWGTHKILMVKISSHFQRQIFQKSQVPERSLAAGEVRVVSICSLGAGLAWAPCQPQILFPSFAALVDDLKKGDWEIVAVAHRLLFYYLVVENKIWKKMLQYWILTCFWRPWCLPVPKI